MEKLKKLFRAKYDAHREMILYLFFGGATTLVNWVVYALLVRLAGRSITVGNLVAWVAAVVFAFVTNKIWVFESPSWQSSRVVREALAFLGSRMASGVVEIVGVPLLVSLGLHYPLFGIQGFAAKVIISVVVIILNYIFSKLFVFRKAKDKEG